MPLFYLVLLLLPPACATAQSTGSIAGEVTLAASGQPLHHADVLIPRLGRKTESGGQGRFRFDNVPPGVYEVVAHMHGLSDLRKTVTVASSQTAGLNFALDLAPVREQIIVSAGREETALESFLSANSISSLDTAAKSSSTSLGDLVDGLAGVHKRSFGPGTTRPVIRGFDGDRVLVLEDGVRTGTLSSQSGDHGEPADASQFERIEIVRGPASLLYGSNAIGGVINTITHEQETHEKPHQGWSGNTTAAGGSNNGHGALGASLRYGAGNWLLWGGAGGNRSGGYHTPAGSVPNSGAQLSSGRFGLGRSTAGNAFRLGYSVQDGSYGVPFAEEEEEIELAFRRHQLRFTGSIRNLGALEDLTVKASYTGWNHRELEGGEVGTRFSNKQLIWRGEAAQKRGGRLSGSFGAWGMARLFKPAGAEALSPPVDQSASAAFILEQVDFERVRLQFGARLERNAYTPRETLPSRAFTGASGSAGANFRLWSGGALAANFTHAFRAPSLEELYFEGPHAGNLTFEVGDSSLKPERSNGIDLSLRHQSRRLQGEFNFFTYGMSNLIYLAPTGEREDNLPVAEYAQAGARYTGLEARLSAEMHPLLWLNIGADAVRAGLTDSSTPLPRIPPVRGRLGLDFRRSGFSFRPEVELRARQGRLFTNETATAGSLVPNFAAGYSIARQHALHVFTVHFFNVTDRLYRNHLSFLKNLVPEMGRGARVSYNLHFY